MEDLRAQLLAALAGREVGAAIASAVAAEVVAAGAEAAAAEVGRAADLFHLSRVKVSYAYP